MAYHRGGHAGAVAVSYSTNAMPTPLSPSRRYSSGSTGTTTSGVGSSSSAKLSSYRSSTSSSFDRPSYYNSGSTSTSGYSSAHRSSYSSEYRRYCSPARSLSVSSSSYSETGTGSSSSGISTSNNTPSIGSSRYGTSTSRDRSESRETLGSLATSAADLYAKYSPANYVPNISASNERNSAITNNTSKGLLSSTINGYGNTPASTALQNNSSSTSSNSAIFGGNSSNAKISSLRDNANELLLSPSNIVQGRPPRAGRRSPVNTVINNHAQQPESAANVEVNYDDHGRHGPGDDLNGDRNNNNNNNNNNINNNNVIEDGKDESNVENLNVNDNDKLLSTCRVAGNLNCSELSYNGCCSDIGDYKSLIKKLESSDSGAAGIGTVDSSIADDGTGLSIAVNNSLDDSCVSTGINQSNNILLTNKEITIISNGNNNKKKSNRKEKIKCDGEEEDHGDADGDSGTFLQSDRINPAHFYQSNLTSFIDEGGSLDVDNSREEVKADGDTAPGSSSSSSSLVYLNSGGANTVVRKTVASRPTGNNAGDNTPSSSSSLPSTSRRGDNYTGNGTSSNGSNGIGNNTSQLAGTTQQNIYRGINEQIEGSPTIRAPRNRLQTPRDERCGLNGLRNIGNTCFMNSVIQCLSNTRPLLEYLVNEQYLADINTATSGMKGALIKAFSQVIQELWEVGGDHVVNTASLKSQIQRFAPRFMGYSQQDAQEFLRYLLEGLHEDVNRVTVKPQPIHTDIPEHYTDSQKAAESWKRYLRNEDSTIVDVFVGQLRSSLHCTSCGHVSVTLDPFWDLSLPIPTRSGTVKLNQCLEHFTKEEVLDGDEKPTCSKCQMRRKCTKSFSIQKFPKILVIHLKRFSPMERFRGKLNTLVDFPLTGLDLGAFSAPRVAGCTYNLYGVANHSGTTYSGHYTAYCKHPYSGEWHEYNDSRVSSIAAKSVVSSEGYVLFYEQQPHSSNL